MKSLLMRFQNGDNSQGIRQSTALTTIYLLEMNRKFESFMRDKVEELEGRVAAQQARLSTKAEAADVDWDDTLIEEETPPVDELEWNDVVPIVDIPPDTSPSPAVTEATVLADRDAPIIDELTPETEKPEEPAAIPDYMSLLVGDQSDAEPEPPDEPMAELVTEEDLDDAPERIDEPDDLLEESEFVATVESEVAARPDVEVNAADIAAEEFPVEEDRTSDEGISAFELLAETTDATVPWFDEEPVDQEYIEDEPSEPDQAAIVVSATVDIPTRIIPEDDDENGDWDAALPAEGQKGQWV